MRNRALAAVLVATLVTMSCRPAPAAAPAPRAVGGFALVVQHSPAGWSATCDSGCHWTNVSLSCVGCDVRLGASGIARAYPVTEPDAGFAFILSAEKDGWSARAVRGVSWERVSWKCGVAPCRARLDQNGVGGA